MPRNLLPSCVLKVCAPLGTTCFSLPCVTLCQKPPLTQTPQHSPFPTFLCRVDAIVSAVRRRTCLDEYDVLPVQAQGCGQAAAAANAAATAIGTAIAQAFAEASGKVTVTGALSAGSILISVAAAGELLKEQVHSGPLQVEVLACRQGTGHSRCSGERSLYSHGASRQLEVLLRMVHCPRACVGNQRWWCSLVPTIYPSLNKLGLPEIAGLGTVLCQGNLQGEHLMTV